MARKKYTIPSQESITYGIQAEEIARICEVSFRTACRWKSGAVVMPTTARMLLCGDLGCFDPEWAGWMVRRGVLISPEGWEISVNMIMGIPLLRQQLAAYRTELRKWEEMPEQPVSEDMPQWIQEKLA